MYSDGPYTITSYTPNKSIQFARNPQWQASTDPLRKAYVDTINVDETGNQTTIYQQMATDSPSLGMSWDALVPPADNPNLLNEIKSGSHNVNLGATYSSNPYLVYNTVSPNNGGALSQGAGAPGPVLRDRAQPADKTLGGPDIEPSAHARPAAGHRRIAGRTQAVTTRTRTTRTRPSPCSPAAGFTASHPLQLKYLYRSDSQGRHDALQQHLQPAERARLGEGDRRAH